jgi:hypothetical protein
VPKSAHPHPEGAHHRRPAVLDIRMTGS